MNCGQVDQLGDSGLVRNTRVTAVQCQPPRWQWHGTVAILLLAVQGRTLDHELLAERHYPLFQQLLRLYDVLAEALPLSASNEPGTDDPLQKRSINQWHELHLLRAERGASAR